MATIKQYAIQLWQTHKIVSRKLGADVSWGDISGRAGAMTESVMLAGLLKILVDKGVITNQDLTTAYTAITNADFPQLPNMVLPVDGGTPPDPDIGV